MTIAEIYNFIGQTLVDSFEEEFSEINLEIKVVGDNISLDAKYEDLSKNIHSIDIKTNSKHIFEAIKEMRQIMGGQGKWNGFNFKVKSDGTFEGHFDWE